MQTGKGGERDAQGEGGSPAQRRRGGAAAPAVGAVRRRDGPRPLLGRARRPAGPGRAGPRRAAPPPNGGGVPTGGRGRPAHAGSAGPLAAGLRLSPLWSPHPAQSVGCGAESLPFRGHPPLGSTSKPPSSRLDRSSAPTPATGGGRA